ncbi:MAG TPA: glycosyltransferase family A protein [Terracidiphilus sp.]|nr:glycosyltransferase family A protein [Terracidiphilus sp.]
MSRAFAEATGAVPLLDEGSICPIPSEGLEHIAVCICTYKRPLLLRRLLVELARQQTGGLFTYSIVVADNDEERSGEAIVAELSAGSNVPVKYCVEPKRNIALARNKVVENAEGDYLALIDDDEFPEPTWLLTHFRSCNEYKVDGVLGPVKRHFDEAPPEWFKKSRIYDRPVNPTGKVVDWKDARTGNVLLRRNVLASEAEPFRPEFRAGEDQDFFRRKIEAGYTFIWSADAAVSETIPPARWKRSYILRKAMLQGATAALQPNCGVISIVKSIIAVPLYLVLLPLALLAGQQYFMMLLVKLFDHSGKLLMLMGISPIREEYVSE